MKKNLKNYMIKDRTIFLMRGLPGGGKTSLANQLGANDSNSEIHAADDYFYENGSKSGVYEFDATKLGDAHKQCQKRVTEGMVNNKTIFVTNTFTTENELKPYLKLADKYNYKVISVIVENRHGNKSLHNVPEDALKRMEDRFTFKLK